MKRKMSTPGEILVGMYLDPTGLTVGELAELTGINEATLRNIINNDEPITDYVANQLSKLYNNTPQFWLNLQSQYNDVIKG